MATRTARDPMAAMTAAITALTQNVTNLTAQVDATNNHVNAIALQLQGAGFNDNNANTQQVTFALSPGLTNVDALIDYRTKHGAAIYQEAKAALPSVFSLKSSEVTLFENELESRAAASGWNSDAQGITKFVNSDNDSITRPQGQKRPVRKRRTLSRRRATLKVLHPPIAPSPSLNPCEDPHELVPRLGS